MTEFGGQPGRLWYPRNDGSEPIVRVSLYDVRAADDLIIGYDFERDGWTIARDAEPDREIAFVRAWSETTPTELTCDDCGRDYPVWFAPNDVWNMGGPERPGFECPSCFAAKYEAWHGKSLAWSFMPVSEPAHHE